MPTLLLRLAGPMQAWGSDSAFEIRRTEFFPTKSGLVGLLAAALGRGRAENVDDLARLKMTVGIRRPGTLIRDYHTVKNGGKTAYVTTRYYLADAEFIVGLESSDKLFLKDLEEAVLHPVYPLFLGRRSCPPSLPIDMGICMLNADQAVLEACKDGQKKGDEEEILMLSETPQQKAVVHRLYDRPVSFNPIHRKFAVRKVYEISDQSHDPMAELEE